MRRLLDGAGGVPGDAVLRGLLGDAIHLAFWAVLMVALLTLLAAMFVPHVKFAIRRRELAVE
jgi:ABC-type proline/glycine betaine transport system permease subunit